MTTLKLGNLSVEYSQTGAGPDLLLVHSLLTEMTVFDRIVPALAASHRVTCVNLPGFGGSSPAVLHSLEDQADHLARVMAGLKLPASTAVFGNGFGAFVCLLLAIRHGRKFGKLLVADCVAAFPEPARVPFRGMAAKVAVTGMTEVLDTAIGRMFPAAFQAAHPQVIVERKAKLAAVDSSCFGRACLALASMDLTHELPTIRNHTLVLCGALDQTTPPALAEKVAQLIAGARYQEIPDSGHCPMLEQSEALVASMLAFLKETS